SARGEPQLRSSPRQPRTDPVQGGFPDGGGAGAAQGAGASPRAPAQPPVSGPSLPDARQARPRGRAPAHRGSAPARHGSRGGASPAGTGRRETESLGPRAHAAAAADRGVGPARGEEDSHERDSGGPALAPVRRVHAGVPRSVRPRRSDSR